MLSHDRNLTHLVLLLNLIAPSDSVSTISWKNKKPAVRKAQCHDRPIRAGSAGQGSDWKQLASSDHIVSAASDKEGSVPGGAEEASGAVLSPGRQRGHRPCSGEESGRPQPTVPSWGGLRVWPTGKGMLVDSTLGDIRGKSKESRCTYDCVTSVGPSAGAGESRVQRRTLLPPAAGSGCPSHASSPEPGYWVPPATYKGTRHLLCVYQLPPPSPLKPGAQESRQRPGSGDTGPRTQAVCSPHVFPFPNRRRAAARGTRRGRRQLS